MSRINIHITSTMGAAVAGMSGHLISLAGPESAIGWGHVQDTLCPNGDEAEALVIMREPAPAGVDVSAEPVGILLIQDEPVREEFLCVADDPSLTSLLDGWNVVEADRAAPWALALARLSARAAAVTAPEGSRVEAERLLDELHDNYFRSTGCLE